MARAKCLAILLLQSLCCFALAQSAKSTRSSASSSTMTAATTKPLYQGYLAFMLLCEPDSKCIPMETKIDIINCMESGMSLAAIYLYKQCTGQGVLMCDDENVSQTVKNCLKVQSGSFSNLITDSSRQCIREKVTLGNIDCYKINQRLRKGGQKFWMQGKLLPSASSHGDGTRVQNERPPVSIFEYAAIVKTSTAAPSTTTPATTTTTSTTTAAPSTSMINPPFPAYDNHYHPFYANHGNNHQGQGYQSNAFAGPSHPQPGNNQNSFPASPRFQQQQPSYSSGMRMNGPMSQPMSPGSSGGYQGSNGNGNSYSSNYNSNANRHNRNKGLPSVPAEDVYEYIEYEEDEDGSDSRDAFTSTTRKPMALARRVKPKTTRRVVRQQSTQPPQDDDVYTEAGKRKRGSGERRPAVRTPEYEEDVIYDPHSPNFTLK